jgi:nucleoside-diphosphate-sugar epimerase
MAALAKAPPPIRIPQWLFRLAEPYLARMLTFDRPMSNADARRALGWSPIFPSYREGLAAMLTNDVPKRPRRTP